MHRARLFAGVAQELHCMPPGEALGEVEHDQAVAVEAGAAVTPQVGPMRLAIARLEHGHWRLVGMQDGLCQQFLPQCIDQCILQIRIIVPNQDS